MPNYARKTKHQKALWKEAEEIVKKQYGKPVWPIVMNIYKNKIKKYPKPADLKKRKNKKAAFVGSEAQKAFILTPKALLSLLDEHEKLIPLKFLLNHVYGTPDFDLSSVWSEEDAREAIDKRVVTNGGVVFDLEPSSEPYEITVEKEMSSIPFKTKFASVQQAMKEAGYNQSVNDYQDDYDGVDSPTRDFAELGPAELTDADRQEPIDVDELADIEGGHVLLKRAAVEKALRVLKLNNF